MISVPSFEDLIDRVASFEAFTVGDRQYSSEHLIPAVTIDSTDLVGEAASTSAFVLYWGQEAARARRFHARVEAAYRSWRDRMWLELKAKPVEETGKYPTDAQCEKLYRTSPDYGVWRGRLDDAQESAEMAEAVYEAFKTKKEMIKAEEKILADEAGGSYYVVEGPRKTVPRQPQDHSAPEGGPPTHLEEMTP
jgi:hypothetical protein